MRFSGDLLEGHVVDLGAQVEHEEDEDGTEQGVDEGEDGSVKGWKHCYTVCVMDGRTCRRTRGRKIEPSRVYTWNQKWNY